MQSISTVQIAPLTPTRNSTAAPVTSCSYGSGRFELTEAGIYFHGRDKDGNEQQPQWICAPLYVIAKTRDEKSGEWGRLLEWQDDDGHIHQWAMPLELLESDGSDVRRELARLGLHISPNQFARGLLSAYLKVWPVEARARCVDRLGWHGNTFVTPTGAIGETEELVVFQNSHAIEPAYMESGTVEEWRNCVAALAAGNTRLVFALPAAKPAALCSSLFCIAQLKPKPLPPLPNIFEPVTFWGNTEYFMNWVFGSFYVNCYRCYRFKDRCPSGHMSHRFRYDITNAKSPENLYLSTTVVLNGLFLAHFK